MSLEQALAANTAALQALTAALGSNPQSVAPVQPAPFIAAVVPPQTAPVVTLDISPAPTTAFAQPVPTPPSAAAPAAPPTASPAASVERDAKGMPWDGRIHASSKAKVADGSWRYKRGVDDTTIAPIEAEIRAALAAPVGGSPAFAPHPFYEPAVVAPPPPAAPAPVVAPPPAAPVAVPVPPVTAITTYDTLMAALPPKIVSGELTAAQMQEACEQYGVPSIAALAQRPDLVPFIAATLKL